jgi:hypothetical protein
MYIMVSAYTASRKEYIVLHVHIYLFRMRTYVVQIRYYVQL